jgi:hypothetical protein
MERITTMKNFIKRLTLIGVAAFALSLYGCDRSDDYSPTTSGSDAKTSEQTAPGSSAAPADSGASSDSSTAASESRSAASEAAGKVTGAVEDSVITTKVKAALLADNQVKGTEIHVDTSNGVVQLSGTVDNKEQISKAESLAKNVEGVKSVDNKLNVKG